MRMRLRSQDSHDTKALDAIKQFFFGLFEVFPTAKGTARLSKVRVHAEGGEVKIGLAQVDGKYPNLALMKLSAWHKAQGDDAEFWNPLFKYDGVYASKVFNDTPENYYLPDGVVRGGTGYDFETELPAEVEKMIPDYSLYPEWTAAIGFTTRGCIRKCPYCVVPRKEGALRVVGDIYSFWAGQKKIVLLDNNLTAAPFEHFRAVCGSCIAEGLSVDFSQGLDIRLVTPEHAGLLARVRTFKQIHFAFDHVNYERAVRDGIKILIRSGVGISRLMFYVLIGYDSTPEQDLYRVELLRGLGVDPFVMPHNRRNTYQNNFARWVNMKAIFKSTSWEVYGPNRMKNEGRERALAR